MLPWWMKRGKDIAGLNCGARARVLGWDGFEGVRITTKVIWQGHIEHRQHIGIASAKGSRDKETKKVLNNTQVLACNLSDYHTPLFWNILRHIRTNKTISFFHLPPISLAPE